MKKALIISIAINCLLVLFYIGKRYYYTYGPGSSSIINASLYDQYDYVRNSIYSGMPIGSCDIVFVGNSLTEGFPVTEIFGSHVKNRGIGGNQTGHILQRLTNIAKAHPKKIFIEAGVNDLRAGLSYDSVFKNYRKIIDIIRDTSPKTLIYVQSVFPTSKEHSKVNPAILQLNRLLTDYCAASGVEFLDIHSKLLHGGQLNNQLTDDGIHLNGNGYKAWKEAVEKYVR